MTDSMTTEFGDWAVTYVTGEPPFYQNGYLVRHIPTGDTAAVDPGTQVPRFTEPVKAAGGTLTQILLTHGHPDHVSGVEALRRAIDGPCHCHRAEKPVLDMGPMMASAFMIAGFEPVTDCDWFESEDAGLTVGGQPVGVLESPGHTPGHVVFVFDGFAFTGDVIFAQGVGRTDFPGGDGPTLGRSIDRLLASLPDETFLFSGHGPEWTAGEAKAWWPWAKGAYGLG